VRSRQLIPIFLLHFFPPAMALCNDFHGDGLAGFSHDEEQWTRPKNYTEWLITVSLLNIVTESGKEIYGFFMRVMVGLRAKCAVGG